MWIRPEDVSPWFQYLVLRGVISPDKAEALRRIGYADGNWTVAVRFAIRNVNKYPDLWAAFCTKQRLLKGEHE